VLLLQPTLFPTYTLSVTPIPPVTINAPVEFEFDIVVLEITNTPVIVEPALSTVVAMLAEICALITAFADTALAEISPLSVATLAVILASVY